MAIPSFAFTSKSVFHLRSNHFFHCVRKLCRNSVAAVESFDEADDSSKCEASNNSVHEKGDSKVRKWKKLNSKDLGISTSMIPNPTRKVLNGLKQKGYDVYLVGGCVRDLILNRTPKDFDIVTSAELREVRKVFPWCEVVGRKFPICHVHVNDTILEVSSFSTSQHRFSDVSTHLSEIPNGFDESDYGRWRNCLHRDFTINGFMFDPYESIVYDYVGGIEDLKKARIRTIIPADVSFHKDSARILRGLRITARLGFRISKETAHCVKRFSGSVLTLGKGRLLMEVNYMLAFGSAEASMRLLWKFGLLELLLPVQAAYFADTGFRRRDERTNMLLSLFSNMDKLLLPDKPCHGSLWVAILAFHKALYDKPQNPLVVAALSLAVHSGGDISEAIEIAGRINVPHDSSFRELAEPREVGPAELVRQVKDLGNGIKSALAGLTDDQVVSRAMSRYSKAPLSDLVLIPLGLYLRVCRVFDCVGSRQRLESKQGSEIDYESLANGSLEEVRHVFARIVFDTVYPIKSTAK